MDEKTALLIESNISPSEHASIMVQQCDRALNHNLSYVI